MTDKQSDMIHTSSTAEMRQTYARRGEQFRTDAVRLGRQVHFLRLVLAATGIGLIGLFFTVVALDRFSQGIALIAAALFFVAAFATLSLFKWQSAHQFALRMGEVNVQGLARIDRDWSRVPVPSVVVADDRVALSKDLDLFGRASL